MRNQLDDCRKELIIRMVKDLEDTRDMYYGYSYVRTIRNILVGKENALIAPLFKSKSYYGMFDYLNLSDTEAIMDRIVKSNQLDVKFTNRGKLYCTHEYYAECD